ncbi:G patch domain-containing protein 1 isoform X2 [Hemicordylus capensis]|uniref:G patch domain-containing protein 1 isoform X2 n=1 Tax=Hemicordylus capensis TaxID=884348 RepID=UPI002303DCE5|nr:G patch domain-containing protein 1 isoform X2 [Hemicordylus capensis]
MAAGGSDEEEEDELVSLGTPLEPLEEGERIKKPIPLQEQTVKDEKGRYKRFHGAFSGGFSAGYFNTVGSKEGWAPSTFVSSRQKRAEKTVLGPEDFMDEEDLGEHGIAPKEITITDEFASKSKDKIKEKAQRIARVVAPIPGATLLDEFIAPAKITIGVDLLRKMGWKEGQGVGPRVKRKPRKQKPEPEVKIYGCSLPPGSEESEEEDDEYLLENVTFAPKDVMPVDLTPKEDVHGLGYKGLDPTKALFGVSEEHLSLFSHSSENTGLLGELQHSKGRKLGISGQAFGVGALEEEDDDIYATESLSRYDTVLKDEEPGDGLYGWTAPQQYKSKQGVEKQLKYIGKVLDGFSLASKSVTSKKKIYLPPDLPKDYKPVHYFRPVIKASSENSHLVQTLAESTGKLESNSTLQSRHQNTASQRRELLGETTLQGPAASVLEYLSEKDKERIREVKQAAVQQMKAPELLQQPSYNQFHAPALHDTPLKWPLGTQLATTGPSDFKPFGKQPEKQKRYENYIETLKHEKKDTVESCLDQNMTEWERGREQEEFSRAAVLYKSSSSVLSSRFTHAKHEDDTDKVEVPRDQEMDIDDKEAAAKMKMFGKLTREKFEWHPDKLLCKRFNVPDPYSESCIVGLPKVKRDKYSVFNFLTVSDSALKTLSKPTNVGVEESSIPNKPKKPSRWDVSDKEKKKKDAISEFISVARSKVNVQEQPPTPVNEKDKNRTNEAVSNKTASESIGHNEEVEEEESRPSMDLFKAIFASSSDEKSSSSEEESDGEDQSLTVKEPASEHGKPHDLPDTPSASEHRKLHDLPDTPSLDVQVITPELPLTIIPPSKERIDQEEEFGPRLPPAVVSDIPSKHEEIQLTSSPEVTKKEKTKKSKGKHKTKRVHKHKKEKKKKHKKHKAKGKHKNKKSEKNSDSDTADSSDSNSEEEITDIPPQELLRRHFKQEQKRKSWRERAKTSSTRKTVAWILISHLQVSKQISSMMADQQYKAYLSVL